MICDFRSDTVTRPTPAMRQAMYEAEVGDDVYGEDPTLNRLEYRVAGLLGKEAAMFVPSGSMANQIAIHLHCRPGESVIAEEDSHCFIYEVGAAAALSGVQFDLIPFSEDMATVAIERRFRAKSLHSAPSRLLVVENTHNRNGGEARSVAEVRRIAQAGRQLGLRLHCDGARLWNAAVKFSAPEQDFAAPFDTVSVCFSKGLGAPVGSALVGPRDFIDEARRIRKRWGGAMRQAGVLAAAALHALEHHRGRLVQDHALADRLRSGLAALVERSGFTVRAQRFPTNMVYVQLPPQRAEGVVSAARGKGLLFHHLGSDALRFVTHMDLPADAPDRVVEFLAQTLR